VAPPEAGRRRDLDVPARLDAAQAHRGLGVGEVVEDALAVFQKGAALEGQAELAGGAQQQFDPQALLQRVDAPPHHRRGHALGRAAADRLPRLATLTKAVISLKLLILY
jgi:hypothetical protein